MPNGELLVGGSFLDAVGTPTSVMKWDGVAWQPVGSGLNGLVQALAVLPNGDIVAGGTLIGSPTNPTPVMRWDGANWTPVGVNITLPVYQLALLPNGDLIAAGLALVPGGSVARWDGVDWVSLGIGGPTSSVMALCVASNGDLIAARSRNRDPRSGDGTARPGHKSALISPGAQAADATSTA
ncbi:MAG: hypothetical protein KDE27_24705 [Planctomycetes bacterium]|nr:hypothetical protein [Planctomycetota bacterium]